MVGAPQAPRDSNAGFSGNANTARKRPLTCAFGNSDTPFRSPVLCPTPWAEHARQRNRACALPHHVGRAQHRGRPISPGERSRPGRPSSRWCSPCDAEQAAARRSDPPAVLEQVLDAARAAELVLPHIGAPDRVHPVQAAAGTARFHDRQLRRPADVAGRLINADRPSDPTSHGQSLSRTNLAASWNAAGFGVAPGPAVRAATPQRVTIGQRCCRYPARLPTTDG